MKKFFSIMFMALVAMAGVTTFTACGGSDDDEIDGGGSSYNEGQVTIQFEDVSTETYKVLGPTFNVFSQKVIGSNLYAYPKGATFSTSFTKNGNSVSSWIQFQTKESVEEGAKLPITAIFWSSDPRSFDANGGDVIAKSVSDDKITLSFKNFKFYRYIKVDSNKKQELTMNGEITFIKE